MDALDQFLKTFFDWQAIGEVIPQMLTVGLPNTLILAVSSAILGCILGLVLAVMGISRNPVLRWISRVYTDIFRGLPAILVIVVIGIGLGPILRQLTGITNPFPLAILALTLMAGAYIGEIFRSGIQSVDKGQLEASRALGFGYGQAMLLVVIPQGIRRVLPALVNQLIALIKDSSLIYLLGVTAGQRELYRVSNDYAANSGSLSPLIAAGLLYLILTVPLTHLVNFMDKRLREGKAARAEPDEAAALVGKGA
ncbi:amino acid ABC transporter permease [Arthrobacter cryoconiti]|uniref:Amino acid ABC transporter permease n=1 Tax=Arthrobacter cryoconiti TaxID=748907 RepID=A0ABV8QZP3_9MICC|nr:amino acid ABC transporter permease [Arthrobacter cryoconiti]MCC9068348.1 amino acid ABC transporter permease [Arthrobacter cryoconiti]